MDVPTGRLALRARSAAGVSAAMIALAVCPGTPAQAAPMPRDGAATRVTLQAWITPRSLRAAVSRIPGYRSHGQARWVISPRIRSWGLTDWYHNTVYISPSVPARYLDSVVLHEWSHILQARDYHLDIGLAVRAMNHWFGGPGRTGIHGAENAADCMAIQLGATWTYYTACRRPAWRHAAARLLHGRQLG